jgi:uncharacterized protein with von Willebrand factor type A (vWA) domain
MPHFEYARFDGTQHFGPLPIEQLFERIAEGLLEHGEDLLRYLEQLPEEHQDLLKQLVKEGLLEVDAEGRFAISPRAYRRIEHKALEDLFITLNRDAAGKHETGQRGVGHLLRDETRPYVFGDPVANLNLHETLRNAFHRGLRDDPAAVRSGKIGLKEEDFAVHDTDHQTSCATVVLLDMSGSMSRFAKFYQAKKVALALQALVRARYPEDRLKVIGFYTYATPLRERQLLLAAPKPVSIFDSRVFLRIPLDNPPPFVPEHFTNIQAGLRFAREELRRQSAENKQILCITDGEPTAHLEGRDLVLIYPPSEKTARATLEEVARCRMEGIQISTVALIEDAFYAGLTSFVDRMAKEARGIALTASATELGQLVFESFVGGRRRKKHV